MWPATKKDSSRVANGLPPTPSHQPATQSSGHHESRWLMASHNQSSHSCVKNKKRDIVGIKRGTFIEKGTKKD